MTILGEPSKLSSSTTNSLYKYIKIIYIYYYILFTLNVTVEYQ